MFNKLLASSRYLVILAVAGSFLIAAALLVYTTVEAVAVVIQAIGRGSVGGAASKALVLDVIEVADLFLLSTVFYIISLGLYELFIDAALDLPPWLQIHSLDDLKTKLVAVIIVVLAVLFLGQAMAWKSGTDILAFGIAIAAIIGALSYFIRTHHGEE